jgi:hypothetical protein
MNQFTQDNSPSIHDFSSKSIEYLIELRDQAHAEIQRRLAVLNKSAESYDPQSVPKAGVR